MQRGIRYFLRDVDQDNNFISSIPLDYKKFKEEQQKQLEEIRYPEHSIEATTT